MSGARLDVSFAPPWAPSLVSLGVRNGSPEMTRILLRGGLDTFAAFLDALCNNGGDFPAAGWRYSLPIPCDAPCTHCARLFGRLEASW